ncbi:MAG: ThiF family adenylyltransferase [Phycisphaerae bacterium]|jgi:hypothetical protein
MSEEPRKLPDVIRLASESLEPLRNVRVIEEWRWYDDKKGWAIKCRLTIGSPNTELVPNETDWYLIVENGYPRGEVELIPAKNNSITKTFQHQYYNAQGHANVPWRNGRICAKTSMFSLKKQEYDIEPFEPKDRLKWHVERAIQWFYDAAAGQLVSNGEFFELPDYDTLNKPYTISFCESQETFDVLWKTLCNGTRTGIVELGLLKRPGHSFITVSFNDHKGQLLYQPPWNENIKSLIVNMDKGVWAVMPEIVVLPPWQAPMTWGELMQVANNQRVDYRKMIARISRFLRDGEQHFVLLGFPISKKISELPNQIHWQPLLLPVLSHDTLTAPGFRTNEMGYSMLDRRILKADTQINWQKSENWHEDEILNRGRYSTNIGNSKTLIIGTGAVGSMISEMLVRGGAKNIVLVDHEKVEIGNLTRHTLTLDDIGVEKVEALQKRLMAISPYVKIKKINRRFENLSDGNDINETKNANIIIDCTGNDDILYHIGQFPWDGRPMFCSISVSLQAKRLYVLVSMRNKFPVEFFKRHINKWLSKDIDEYNGEELPRSGGIGCWHPAFPARTDEMWLLAATALKYVASYVESETNCSKLAIFEQMQGENFFGGVKLIEECDDR